MLNSEMDAFWDDSRIDAFVTDDTDGLACHVEHSSGFAVVEFVRHTTMNSAISDDVNVVSFLVIDEVFAETWHSMLSEWFGEQISRSCSETEAVWHLSLKPSKYLI